MIFITQISKTFLKKSFRQQFFSFVFWYFKFILSITKLISTKQFLFQIQLKNQREIPRGNQNANFALSNYFPNSTNFFPFDIFTFLFSQFPDYLRPISVLFFPFQKNIFFHFFLYKKNLFQKLLKKFHSK